MYSPKLLFSEWHRALIADLQIDGTGLFLRNCGRQRNFFNDTHTSVSSAVKHPCVVLLSNRRLHSSQGPICTHLIVAVRHPPTPLLCSIFRVQQKHVSSVAKISHYLQTTGWVIGLSLIFDMCTISVWVEEPSRVLACYVCAQISYA